jgi:hypothetical protein
MPTWLPPLLCLQDFGSDFPSYLAALYDVFHRDFVVGRPTFRGHRVGIKRHPQYDGKEATFWHLISEGRVEADRLPDLRRCERIYWPRAVIDHESEPEVKVWENKRGSERRECLWLEWNEESGDYGYLVVLAIRSDYVILWTAYPVTWRHTRNKLMREYQASRKG